MGRVVRGPLFFFFSVPDPGATLARRGFRRRWRVGAYAEPNSLMYSSGARDLVAMVVTVVAGVLISFVFHDRFSDALVSEGDSCHMNLSTAKITRATDNIPIMMKSSFRPVFAVTEDERSTSRSNFTPSGVNSNA